MCNPKPVLRHSPKKAAAESASAAASVAASVAAGGEAEKGEAAEVDVGERFDGPEPVLPCTMRHHVHHALVWSAAAALMVYDGFFWSFPLTAFMLWYGDAYTAVLHCALDRPGCLDVKILTARRSLEEGEVKGGAGFFFFLETVLGLFYVLFFTTVACRRTAISSFAVYQPLYVFLSFPPSPPYIESSREGIQTQSL